MPNPVRVRRRSPVVEAVEIFRGSGHWSEHLIGEEIESYVIEEGDWWVQLGGDVFTIVPAIVFDREYERVE